MPTTHITQFVRAPRARVYAALTDGNSVAQWMVPDGMTIVVHSFQAREGGTFRVSLTYTTPDGVGKSGAHTDTYHGRFVRLIPDNSVVQEMEFETADPNMQGVMTVSFTLTDAINGTSIDARHDDVPAGVSAADNEKGWKMSLGKLAKLVESADS